MARVKKIKDVQKFGGVDDLGSVTEVGAQNAPVKDVNYDIKSLEVQSDTKLQYDEGHGAPAIIRRFTFGINPQAWMEVKPTKQELFNSHLKGIEIALWRDGMEIITDVTPRIVIDAEHMRYDIFIGAKPQRGHILREKPKTLTEIAHG